MEDYKEKIRNLYNKVRFSALLEDSLFAKKLEEAFPELKESEDERIINYIKKAIIDYWSDEPLEEILDWLEKQGQTFTKKDVDDAYLKGICDAKHELEKQNHAWNEEDEKMWLSAIEYVRTHPAQTRSVVEWLKSLKDRVQMQPKQEWSEEDEIKIESIIAFLKSPSLCAMDGNKDIIDANIKYLKSFKHQNRWKPSDEQMDALETAVSRWQSIALESLYNDLEKL